MLEIKGSVLVAKEQYDKLLEEQISPSLRSDILRQLGWMHHINESLGDPKTRQIKAVNLLLESIGYVSDSSQSYYYLGRCYATLDKVQDAFLSYRNSVEKADVSADTWCSIGVLYQKQNQLIDALQAYICSAQIDKKHKASWTNLGILYEGFNQLHDAYRCYWQAISCKSKPVDFALFERLKYLKSQLKNIPPLSPKK